MVPSRRFSAVVLYLASTLAVWMQHATAELVLLVTLTRHGSRAPNTVVDELCPNNRVNRLSYNVPPGQLTENGMKQGYDLGVFLRETYVETLAFLPPTLGTKNDPKFNSGFTSDAAERCLMTAQAMAQGLYPNGTGPPGFPTQPVPVQTNQKQFDNLLAAAHGACLPSQKADNNAFDETRGAELVREHKNLTDIVTEACGASLHTYSSADSGKEGLILGVKDVSDMINFDEQQGLESLPALTDQVKREMTALAFQLLQERYYTRPEQVAYWAGDLPKQLLKDFYAAAEQHSKGEIPARLYIGYHGHRELLYGLAHLLGWNFDVQEMPRALGTSAIPPGTTMFFELHHHNETMATGGSGDFEAQEGATSSEDGYYYVRTFTWTPRYGQQEVVLDACKTAKAGRGCLLTNLTGIIDGRMDDVGTWEDICGHIPFDKAEKIAHEHVYHSSVGMQEGGKSAKLGLVKKLSAVAAILSGVVLIWLGILVVKKKLLARQGIADYETVA